MPAVETERRSPVFLVGAERSGSTMMRLMLNHHPDIAFAGESDFIVDAITPEGRFMKREAFLRMLSLDRVFGNRKLNIAQGLNFVGLANDFLDQIAATKGNPAVVGMTVHRHFDRLLHLWPDARFIHLVRDGRDVALSTIPMGWAGNMWRGIRLWVEAEDCWHALSERLPDDRIITVKYEHVARDAEYELRRVTDFLGLPFGPEMLRYSDSSTYSSPHGDSVGKWRKADPKDLSAAEFRGARWLLQNGYLLSGTIKAPSIFRRAMFRVQDRVVIANYRRKKFGTKLWLESLIYSRFGSKKQHARIVRAQNVIIDRHLK
ncbi:sulfotransferase family protein [Sphingomonas montanisoli]|uniref:Sulfotransferase n=1 Tax=Sphingomonas montanisoli TaxID=2606412 RepID=A0A5D9CCY2_9SPHN|nr:sulfotransferase [Sphingomonas montanisoli]TZG29197.1 sulfotransferase [Sphingomonas montanisoli]